jgi:hypothetical protein
MLGIRYVALVYFPEGSRARTIWSDAKFFFPVPSTLSVVISLQDRLSQALGTRFRCPISSCSIIVLACFLVATG